MHNLQSQPVDAGGFEITCHGLSDATGHLLTSSTCLQTRIALQNAMLHCLVQRLQESTYSLWSGDLALGAWYGVK